MSFCRVIIEFENMKNKLKIFEILIAIILFSGIFISSIHTPMDPDLGWHLKYGEYFFENGKILRDNIFSQLMPDYKWNNSSWATDLITYQTFSNFGFIGLSLLGSLVITLTFFFLGKAAKLHIFEKVLLFPIILWFVLPVNQVAFRGQLISLLFIAIMYYLLSRYEENKKVILLLIPFFTLWSNLHGEFILGLALLGIWSIVFGLKEIYLNYRKNITKFFNDHKILILTVIGSGFSTLVNPFGIGIYLETIKHFGDPMQKSITEWQSPGDFTTVWWHQLFIALLGGIGIAMMGIGKKTLDKAPFYVPSIVLFFLTFGVRRYAWPFYYSTVFLLKPIVSFLKPDKEKHSLIAAFVLGAIFLGFSIWGKYPFTNVKEMTWNDYCKKSVSCSPRAAQTVIAYNLNNDKLLTIYDYGGWLIWNYPQIKPTVDGRMHLWRDEKGYSGFEWFHQIEQGTNPDMDIDKTEYNAVLTSRKKPIYFRLVQLTKEGKWKSLHVDKYGAVFVRNKNVN
jgi:hypothetical protein